MSYELRKAREVLRKFDPRRDAWHDAYLVLETDDTIRVETLWQSREVHGTWVYTYPVSPQCFGSLLSQKLIEPTEESTKTMLVYRLSGAGKKRLGL